MKWIKTSPDTYEANGFKVIQRSRLVVLYKNELLIGNFVEKKTAMEYAERLEKAEAAKAQKSSRG